MADSPNNPNQPGKQGKKELTMETRLLIAFLLMGLVLFLTPYLYKPTPAPPAVKPPAAPAQTAQETKKPEPQPPKPATPAQPVPGEKKASTEQEFVVDTQLYRIRFTNVGAVARSWVLKKYMDHSGKPLELVNQSSLAKVPLPFSVEFKDHEAATGLNYALYVAKPAADGLSIDYEFSDGKNYCKKSFHFAKNGYLSQVTSEVTQNGVATPHQIEWRGGF